MTASELATGPRRDGTCFYEADPDLSLARRSLAEALGSFLLTGLILVFGAVSGGYYNPLVSLSQWRGGHRSPACLVAYATAQIAGAGLGARLATLAFGLPASSPRPGPPLSAGVLAAEMFATAATAPRPSPPPQERGP